MIRTTVKISGMSCGMCEAHINDLIRREFNVKKAEASRKNGEAVIISEQPIPQEKLKAAIEALGYGVGEIAAENFEKKSRSVFGIFKGHDGAKG